MSARARQMPGTCFVVLALVLSAGASEAQSPGDHLTAGDAESMATVPRRR